MRDERDDAGRRSPAAGVVTELRRDIVSGNHVLVAPHRSGRPSTVTRSTPAPPGTAPGTGAANRGADRQHCPFCPGNEGSTAEELVRSGPDGPQSADWRVRVVRNRYPVLGSAHGATGDCEVVVFRSHDRRLEDLDDDEMAEIMWVVRERVAAQLRAGRASVQVFVNAEAEAGASIAHPHAQIIGLDFVPPALALELDLVAELGSDPLARDLAFADEHGLVVADGAVTAWCPPAMQFPYSVRVAPRVAPSPFHELDPDTIAAVARTVRDVLGAINRLLGRPPYNVVLFCDQARGDLLRRWRIEVVPRTVVPGGFEIGTAVGTHATATPDAAEALRRLIREDPEVHTTAREVPMSRTS